MRLSPALSALALSLAACSAAAPDHPPVHAAPPASAPPVDPSPRRFVSPAGDDAAACTEAAPCRTIDHALQGAAPGTTVIVSEGHYPPFVLRDLHGTAERPLTVLAPGRNAEIDPGKARDTIYVTRSTYLVIDGLRAASAHRAAVRVSGGHHVTIRRGNFGDPERWGIFTDFTDDFTAELNECHGARKEHGIYVSNSGDRPTLRSNFVHDNAGCGLQINADEETPDHEHVYQGVVDGLTTGALLEGNIALHNGQIGGAAINLDGVQDSVLRDNLLVENFARGIVAYGDADGIPGDRLQGGRVGESDGNGHRGPSGLTITRNTVISRKGSARRSALLLRYSFGERKNVVRENILLHEGQASIELGSADDLALLESGDNALERVTLDGHDLALAELQQQGRERGSEIAALPALFPALAGEGALSLDALLPGAGSAAPRRGALVAAVLAAVRAGLPDARF
jgi:hypothetical protein